MLWSKYLLSPVSQSHQISKSLSLYLSLSLCVLAFVFYHRLWSIVGKSHNSVESPLNAFMALIIRGPADRPSMSLIELSWSAKKHHFDIYLTKPPNAEEEAAMALLVLGRFVLLQLDLKKKLRYRRISSWFAKTLYRAHCFLIQIVVPFYTIILF